MLRALAAALLAAPLQLGAFSLDPPPGFHPDPALAGQTTALAPLFGEGEPDRRLVAYLTSGEGRAAASLALSTVDAPLALDPALKQLYAAAVAGHFKRQLGLAFELDRTALVGRGASRRVEVWGSARLDGQPRTLAVAFFPGERTHVVAVASLPAERAVELTPLLEAALDTYTAHEPSAPWARSRAAISLGVWGLAGLVFAAVRLARRRREQRDLQAPGP